MVSKIPTEINVGFKIGSTIRKNVCNGLHPSIIAASSISSGITITIVAISAAVVGAILFPVDEEK